MITLAIGLLTVVLMPVVALCTSFVCPCGASIAAFSTYFCYNIYAGSSHFPNFFTEILEVCTSILTPLMEIINVTFLGG